MQGTDFRILLLVVASADSTMISKQRMPWKVRQPIPATQQWPVSTCTTHVQCRLRFFDRQIPRTRNLNHKRRMKNSILCFIDDETWRAHNRYCSLQSCIAARARTRRTKIVCASAAAIDYNRNSFHSFYVSFASACFFFSSAFCTPLSH